MDKESEKKPNDYVSKLSQKRAKRIKELMTDEGYGRTGETGTGGDFATKIGMKAQNLSRTMKRNITDKTCQQIINAFPKYNLQWLLGYSDIKLNRDLFISEIQKAETESQLLDNGLLSFTQLSGFTVDFSPIDGSIEEIIHSIESHCTISKDDKSITLSLEDLRHFENEICDYVEFRLLHMMK